MEEDFAVHETLRRCCLTCICILGLLAEGCDTRETEEQKQARAQEAARQNQVNVCIDDVKQGLNDPNSIEILETSELKLSDGTHRITLEYTARNSLGGR